MANNVAASMKASIVIDKKEVVSSVLSAYAEAQKEIDGHKLEFLIDVSDDKALEKIKEIQKELTGKDYVLKFKNQGVDEIVENLNILEKRLKDIFSGKAFGSGTGKGIGNSIVDEKSLQTVLDLFTKMESHLGDMKRVFSDVGDGGEFSPLLSTIEKINASIAELSKSVKGIGLNMNIDFGSDKELEAKAEAKISNALQAYQRLFDHIKMTGAGGSIITQKFFDFDIDQFDGMMGKLNAYKKFIENMRTEAKEQFSGNDVLYQETDKKYWTSVSSAMGQVTKAFNEMKASGDTNPLEKIFGGSKDLSEVTTQLSLITDKLDEISKSASEFKNVFKEGFNVSSSIEDIEKLTNRVKELEEELSKVKLSPNVPSTPIKDTFQRGHSDNSEPAGVTRYQKHGYKARDNGNHDNEVAVADKKKLGEALKGLQNEIIASIDESTQFIKEVTDFYDSNDNLVKTQMKIVDQIGNMSTYTTSYSQDKDGNMTAWTSHITTEKLLEAKKAEEKIEKDLQKQKDSFNKKNLTAIDLEIQKREELSKITSSDIKTQMEERQKLVSSMESEIKSLNERYDTLNLKPSDANRSVEYQGALDRYKSAITDLQSYLDELNKTPVISEEQKNHWNELIINVNKVSNELKSFSAAEKGSTEAGRWKEIDKISKYLDKNTRISREAKQELKEYLSLLKSGSAVNIEEIHMQFNKIAEAERVAGREGKAFFDILKDKAVYGYAAQLASYYLSIMDLIRYAKNAVNAVRELDTALVDLKKTTQMTSVQLEDFYFDSNDVAKEMGVTTKAIIDQASAWSRLGFATKETSTEMAKLSAQFAAISPGMDLDTSTDGLVSTMKAFNIEVEDVERRIMDNINKVGNTAATDNTEIVDMLTRSSAAMAVANNTLEETIALETAAVEITRSAESTGTAFKTLSMRIRGYDEETGELADDLQNISGEIADLTKTASTPGGISLFTDDTKQTYKSTYQILKEISEIYDELTDKQSAQLLEKLAGKRGGQVVASLLTNFDAAEEALKNMSEAAGSADAEMSIVEESIDYKLNALKETWVGVAQEMVDRGDFGKVIDALTRLSEAIGFVLDKLGLLGTVGLGAGIFAGAKNVGIGMLVAY